MAGINGIIGIPEQGPYSVDVQALVMRLLTQVLGMALPPDLAGLVSGPLATLVSGKNPGTLFSNQTNAGIFNNWQRNMARATGNALATDIANSVRRQTMGSMYHLLKPGAETREVSAFVDNLMSKWGFSTAYGLVDSALGLDYSSDIGNYTGLMAANQAMNMLRRGAGPDSFVFAEGLAKNFFGDGPYNAGNYGGLSQRGAAMLASRLGEHMDLTQGVNPYGDMGKQAESAARRLRDAVRNYGKALEPLKDVFGDDIPAMLEMLEQVTGKAVGAMPASRIADISSRLANAVMAGNYTAQQFAATNAAVNSTLARTPGLQTHWYTMSPALAGAVLDMQTGNTSPYYMSDAQYSGIISQLATHPASLAGGDDFVKAYILWRNKARRNGMAGTQEQFEAAMRRMGGGVNIGNAMRLAGVFDEYGLMAAYNDPEYHRLVASGMGGEMQRQQLASHHGTRLINANAKNRGLQAALRLSANGVARATGQMLEAMERNGELMNMESPHEIMGTLRNMGYNARDAFSMAQLLIHDRNNPVTNQDLAVVHAINGERASRARARQAAELRQTLNGIDNLIVDPNRGLSTLLKGQRWTAEGIANWLNASKDLVRVAPGWKGYVDTVMQAGLMAADMAMEPPPSGDVNSAEYKKWEEKRQAKGRHYVNYALTQKGLTNATFQRAMKEFRATPAENRARRAELAAVMEASSTEGLEESVAEFLGDPGNKEQYAARQKELADIVNRVSGYERNARRGDFGVDDHDKAVNKGLYEEIERQADGLDGKKGNVTDADRLKIIDKMIDDTKNNKGMDADTRARKLGRLNTFRRLAAASSSDLRERIRVGNYQRSMNDLYATLVGEEKTLYNDTWKEIEKRASLVDSDAGDYTTAQDRLTAIRQMIKEEKSKEGGGNKEQLKRLEEFERRAVNAAKSTAEPFNLGDTLGKILTVLGNIFKAIPRKPGDGEPPPDPESPRDAAYDYGFNSV